MHTRVPDWGHSRQTTPEVFSPGPRWLVVCDNMASSLEKGSDPLKLQATSGLNCAKACRE